TYPTHAADAEEAYAGTGRGPVSHDVRGIRPAGAPKADPRGTTGKPTDCHPRDRAGEAAGAFRVACPERRSATGHAYRCPVGNDRGAAEPRQPHPLLQHPDDP